MVRGERRIALRVVGGPHFRWRYSGGRSKRRPYAEKCKCKCKSLSLKTGFAMTAFRWYGATQCGTLRISADYSGIARRGLARWLRLPRFLGRRRGAPSSIACGRAAWGHRRRIFRRRASAWKKCERERRCRSCRVQRRRRDLRRDVALRRQRIDRLDR